MKAVIVSSFDTYLERIELLKEYYESIGYKTIIIMSNFKHIKKEFIKIEKKGYIYIDTKPYYKNLSIQRLYSHYNFAKNAFCEIKYLKPDLLHVLIPANSLAKEAGIYKKNHPNVRLILDLIDLWPETMPIGKLKNIFPFTIWKNIRDKYLSNADIVFTECNLYRKILNKENDLHFKTLYWAKKDEGIFSAPNLNQNEIHLCYLGSINNIIDINSIIEICKNINKIRPVILEIIGSGEKKELLIENAKKNFIHIIDHGVIYNKSKKQEIFDRCHFGLNIYKNSVCIGLTMKSLDYFQAGLPIINNIKGDTWDLIKNMKAGINSTNNFEDIKEEYLSNEYNLALRNNSLTLSNKYFSKNSFFLTIANINKKNLN